MWKFQILSNTALILCFFCTSSAISESKSQGQGQWNGSSCTRTVYHAEVNDFFKPSNYALEAVSKVGFKQTSRSGTRFSLSPPGKQAAPWWAQQTRLAGMGWDTGVRMGRLPLNRLSIACCLHPRSKCDTKCQRELRRAMFNRPSQNATSIYTIVQVSWEQVTSQA